MAEAVLDIKQWGNNLGVRLPATVVKEVHLHVGKQVCVSVNGTQVVITPIVGSQLSLEQRLAAFDPVRHGGEYFCRGVRTTQPDYQADRNPTKTTK